MSALADLQRQFQEYLCSGLPEILGSIRRQGGLAPDQRLGIYRNAYRQRLIETLANDYPGLAALLGETGFTTLGLRYVAAYPSHHPSLRWFGKDLPTFTADDATLPPESAGMARFDWAVTMAFDAPDERPVAMDDLLALPPQAAISLRLTFVSSLAVVAGSAVLGEVRCSLLRPDLPAPKNTSENAPRHTCAAPDETAWLIWRQGEQINYRALAPAERASFEVMRAGGTFEEMCACLAASSGCDNPALTAATFLKDWIERGLVAALLHDAALSN